MIFYFINSKAYFTNLNTLRTELQNKISNIDLDTKLQKKADKLQASIGQKANQADLNTLRNSVNQQETELQVNLDQLRNFFNENNLNNLQQDPEEKQGGCTIV